MIRDIENYFLQKEEPVKSCLLALRQLVMRQHRDVEEVWRYKMPFYCLQTDAKTSRRFCYLWVEKKTNLPYIGIVDGNLIEHPDLLSEKRSRMKILLIDPENDLPVEKINVILQQAIALCQN
ncbi:DUF1801 domain-containing protein [Dyadobacter sp. CY312]|uniref:DUF1801 domain-containing protein n=1 Tax=Dyadobacter sp. CY312 TaxID=2907303 RepID=UPI001F25C9A0|nr:DUF1801 domain-containing protein [Dyadobacter sp. CY312]MCE7039664.1 DUF1801 domain-containing protein [Dyadobacter sp. CY312]